MALGTFAAEAKVNLRFKVKFHKTESTKAIR